MLPDAMVNGNTFELWPPTVTATPSEQVALIEEFSQNVYGQSTWYTWVCGGGPLSYAGLITLDSV